MLATTKDLSTQSATLTPSPRSDSDDKVLIHACLLGDEQAWEVLLTRYSRLIYTIPLRFGFGDLVAEEIFQEVCIILLEKLDTLHDAAQFKPWLVTLTRRVCLQRLREQQKEADLETIERATLVEETPEQILLLGEEHQWVQQAFATLDARCQRLLSALFMDQSAPSYEMLAKVLEVSVGSVGPIRSRCLDKLRQALLQLDQYDSND